MNLLNLSKFQIKEDLDIILTFLLPSSFQDLINLMI